MYHVKGIAVSRCLVILWWSVGGGEVLYITMTRSQSFSEPVPLDCKLHTCFSVFSPLLDGAEWLEWFELNISLLSGELGSDNTPLG